MANVFTVDYETNDLFFKYFFDLRSKKGKFSAQDLEQVLEAYQHVSPMQVGVHTGEVGAVTKHLNLFDLKSSKPDIDLIYRDNKGRRQRSHTVDDLRAYLATKESKWADQPKKINDYIRDIGAGKVAAGDRTAYVHDEFYVSKFSQESFMGVGAEEHNRAIQARMDFSDVSMEKFVKSTADEKGVYKSVHSIMSNLLDGATVDNPAKFQAWNATFDFNATLSFLKKGGHSALLWQTIDAYNSGALEVVHMEEGWQKMAYGLTREHQSAFEHLITKNDPNTVFALGEYNQKVRSFKQFQYSTMPWSQDYLSKDLFSFIKGMEDQIHFAGPDVEIAKLLQSTTDEWADIAVSKALMAGFDVSSVEDIWNLPGENKFVTEALDEVIEKMGMAGNKPTSAEFVSKLSRKVDNAYMFQTRGQGTRVAAAASGGGGGRAFTNIFGDSFGGPGMKGMKRNLALGIGIGAALVAMTYSSDKEEKSVGRYNYDISTKGAVRISSIERAQASGQPHIINSPTRDLIVPGLITTGLVTAIGAEAARRKASTFGYKYTKPESFSAGAREAFKTFRYGMGKVEETVPLTRVFNVSSMLNTIFGTRSLKQSVTKGVEALDGDKVIGRGYSFNVIDKGRIIDATDTKLANLDRFLQAAMEANPEHASRLQEILRPSEIAGQRGNITRRVVTIGETGKGFNKKTVLSVRDFTPEDIKAGKGGITKAFELDLVTKISKMRRRSSLRGSKEMITNSIAYAVGRTNEIFQGRHDTVSFEKYLSFQNRPRVISRYPWMRAPYVAAEKARYKLGLNAKGLGQGKDFFRENITSSMLNKDATIHIQRFSGSKGFSIPGIKRSVSYLNDLGTSAILQPIDTFLEAPLELIGFDANKLNVQARRLINSGSLHKNIAGKAISFLNKPHLGLGYDAMKYGMPEYLLKFGVKRVLPAYLALNLFDVADKGMGVLATGDNESPGLLRGGAIWGYQKAILAYTAASDITGMTAWAKWQDKAAPGSTGLGVAAPGMSALLSFKAGKFLYDKSPGFKGMLDQAFDANRRGTNPGAIGWAQDFLKDNVAKNKWVKRAIKGEGFVAGASNLKLSNGQKVFNYMLKNPKMGIFMAASLPMIPFLPGFLGSDKSYEERRAEFAGEKEVAIRKYRGWLLSTSPFEGDKVNQYRQHASHLMSKDWEGSGGVIFPSFTSKALNRLSFGFLKPNVLEEYHAEAQPVYSASSPASNVTLAGPILAALSNKMFGGKNYHRPEQSTLEGKSAIADYKGKVDGQTAAIISGAEFNYAGDASHMAKKFFSQTTDLAGFRGFMLRSAVQQATGQSQPGEFTPYLETSSKLYNQAHKVWGYQAGDITVVAGEFLRRIYQNPNHDAWMVNELPNELMSADWIPKDSKFKDFTRGTTFDKIPMGWLLGSRKGWEYQYGTKGQELNDYSDPVRLEILQQIAPYSPQFRETSKRVMDSAMAGDLTPGEEQRFYETLDQVSEIKTQIWAHANEGATSLNTLEMVGLVDDIDATTGKITIQGHNSPFSIAGVSFVEADIRKRLLDTRSYETSAQLEEDLNMVQENLRNILESRVQVGEDLRFQMVAPENMPTDELYNRDLTNELIAGGAALANTGPMASHKVVHDRLGEGSGLLAEYWHAQTNDNTYFNEKLISERDYIQQYSSQQVFSKQVRLWTKPIDHLLKPMISQTLNRVFGIDTIPEFTEERRARQQYWDTIKYTKYKMLENQARRDGDLGAAQKYKNKWRQTMVGANPVDANPRDERMAMSKGERAYFDFISNETDPERRAKIFKYLPKASQRIYKSIWNKKLAQAEGDYAAIAEMQELEGYDITEEERELYQEQTGGDVSVADWIRAQVVAGYAETNALPGADWAGWAPNVDIDNIELLSLKDEGEQIQDYGFFDEKLREAVFDDAAYGAAMYINDLSHTPVKFYGTIIPTLLTGGSSKVVLPTSAPNENSHIQIETNDYDKVVKKSNEKYAGTLGDKYI